MGEGLEAPVTPPTRYTGNTPAPEVVEATATQIQAIINRLAPDHTLPRKPTRGSFWHQLREEIRNAYLARAEG